MAKGGEGEEQIPIKNKDTKQISFELLKEGKTPEEIAGIRSLAVSTIEGHLSHFVRSGELDIHELMPQEKFALISGHFQSSGDYLLNPAKAALGDGVSYSELRYVLNYLRYTGEKDKVLNSNI